MRIMHTGDWHLGRLFHRVNLIDDQRHVLQQVLKYVEAHQPDVLLVAGDIYDRKVPPADAVRLLDDMLAALVVDLQVTTVMIAGNHDSADRLSFGSRVLAGQHLHVFGRPNGARVTPLVLQDAHGPLYVYPLPYPDPVHMRQFPACRGLTSHRALMRTLVEQIVANHPPGMRAVLLGHALVEGGRTRESERPLTLTELEAEVPSSVFDTFTYVALGHLHLPQAVGSDAIRYCGSILPYSFSEADEKKSVVLLEIDSEGLADLEQLPLEPRRHVRCVEGHLKDILDGHETGAEAAGSEDYVRVQLLDKGPLVDVTTRLRQVYPNLLEVDRVGLVQAPRGSTPLRQQATQARTLVDQFGAFFAHVTGDDLDETLKLTLEETLSSNAHGDTGVATPASQRVALQMPPPVSPVREPPPRGRPSEAQPPEASDATKPS